MSEDREGQLMRNGLAHAYAGLSDDKFFELIDDTGGWPLGYEYVGFAHSDGREAGFTHTPIHHGWWTTLFHADDYYIWKLSPDGMQKIADAVRNTLSIPRADAAKISIKSWRGHTAVTQKRKAVK